MQWPEVQQLCMLEVLTDEEGDSPDEDPEATGDGGILHSESSKGKHNDCRGGTKYYNKEQQMELVLAAQGMMHDDAHQDSNVRSEEASAVDANQTYIWEDVMCMGWLKEGSVPDEIPGKRRALSASWEGPYQFIGHADGKGDFDFEEGCRICVVQDANGRRWERSRRDLQIYYIPPD
ncbi:unnamed protein product [Sphagnum jensenii]|uniref:Uncharacterized protein n=1 Tax=Sphagnum jensenii TaxID=128206 RepID=A0ABP0VH44_9BRYO